MKLPDPMLPAWWRISNNHTSMKTRLLSPLSIFAGLVLATSANAAILVNGGFETGDFTGWNAAGGSKTVTTTSPLSGTYSAQLTDSTSGPVFLSQAFTPLVGGSATLSFNFFVTAPTADEGTNRPLEVSLRNDAGSSFLTLRLVDLTLDGDGELETLVGPSLTWTSTGINSVAFGAVNSFTLTLNNLSATPGVTTYGITVGSESVTGLTGYRGTATPDSVEEIVFAQVNLANSTLKLDNVSIVPKPHTALLGGLGLLALLRRRR